MLRQLVLLHAWQRFLFVVRFIILFILEKLACDIKFLDLLRAKLFLYFWVVDFREGKAIFGVFSKAGARAKKSG